jgi:outer membrane protein OmpA-like peptidoglycan-associated protein
MKLRNWFFTAAFLVSVALPLLAQERVQERVVDGRVVWVLAERNAIAIKYPDNKSSNVDMRGVGSTANVTGRAEAKRADGRTRIKLRINNLSHPQSLGSFYTTYVIWAITPEGQADNLGELPQTRDRTREIEVTTPQQNFALIVTAEPHGLVRYPGPLIVAENIIRSDTRGEVSSSQIAYRGDPGVFYVVTTSDRAPLQPDYTTPLNVLGARRAVEIARRANAQEFAATELQEAERRLAALEQLWPPNNSRPERFNGEAREVMRLAEVARAAAVERFAQARLDAERRSASQAVNQAQTEAERARAETERARAETERIRTEAEQARRVAEEARAAATSAQTELAQARERAAQAQTEAERAKANEEVARLEAERARLESESAKRERDAAMQRLQISLSEILETRREARGLIVNLSDVLFDFDKATLKPGAREKLSKLTGVLLAYPGNYRIEIEGHTDAVGSDAYNQKLSEDRAQSVRDYLASAGLPTDRIVATRGFGKTRPVTTNDTPEGRQMNRRVEIIIADTEPQAATR